MGQSGFGATTLYKSRNGIPTTPTVARATIRPNTEQGTIIPLLRLAHLGARETSRRGSMIVVSSSASAADRYRVKAAELSAKALQESRADLKAEYERLAASYLLLAAQAERNSTNDVVYEPPLQTGEVRQAQQQQQMQPKRKP